MLRYVLEDCTSEKVPIRSEIDYMQNLIDFYKMKSPGRRKIKFIRQIEHMDIHIAPMLFIPFIENSFKYSWIEETNPDLSDRSPGIFRKLKFTIKNSIFWQEPSLTVHERE
jgi:sensor histidine kinase YesM